MTDLTSPKIIKELLQNHGAAPSKTMGQNFLIDKNILQKILEASNLQPNETVVEIGPGIGTLTQALAGKAKKVIAIEKDRAMVGILQETLKEYDNVEVL
ncbi:16S rRNA (adenine(1518)-N(6)/adenine(1519)-N(6))-dimethyltransferase, partial [Candidatus Parcubacteria bacterium]|nr:16S rRNA (adenine(1518)-N(6)/adenine(1519)-N(6))-dimethyltransferase [Candidatus Parcubacteria bacterium]